MHSYPGLRMPILAATPTTPTTPTSAPAFAPNSWHRLPSRMGYFTRIALRYHDRSPFALYGAILVGLASQVRRRRVQFRIFSALACLFLAANLVLAPLSYSSSVAASTGAVGAPGAMEPPGGRAGARTGVKADSYAAPYTESYSTDQFLGMGAWQDNECFGGCSYPATWANDGQGSSTHYWASRGDGGWRVIMAPNANLDPNCTQCVPAKTIKTIRFYQNADGGKYATSVTVNASVYVNYFAYGIWDMTNPVSVTTNVPVGSGWNEITLPGNANYRMYNIEANSFSSNTGTWRVQTIQGFSGEPAPPPPAGDLFLHAVGAWDDNECFGGCSYPASSAIDGSEGTEWHARSEAWRVLATNTADPNHPELIPPVAITKIRFFNGGNFATSVDIKASYDVSYFAYGIWDMVNPVTVISNVTTTYGWNEITLPGNAYRMYQIVADAHNGTGTWSMHTVEGFGNNTPWDSEGYGGGSSAVCSTRDQWGPPVDTAIGNFWHTFPDLSVPGRGFGLDLSHTYNAFLSSSNQNMGLMGYGWSHSYNWYINQDGSGNFLVHQGNGAVMPFNPDYSHPLRVEATLTNTGSRLILTTTHGLDTYVFHSLDGSNTAGKLDHITDRDGNTTSLSYNADGSLNTVTDPASRTLTFSYSGGLLSSVADSPDPQNRSVSFHYNANGELWYVTDVGGQRTYFTYETVNGYHRLLTITDPNSGVLTNQYDASSRVITQTDPLNRTTAYGYYDLGNGTTTTRITDTLGLVSILYYANNMLTQMVYNPGDQQRVSTRSYQYATIWPSKITDPLGNSIIAAWDNQGNVISITDTLARNTQYVYNVTNDPTIITNSLGITTTFGYDAYGNVTTVTNPLTQTGQLITTTLGYDSTYHGDLVSVTNPLTKTWTLSYDQFGYVYTSTDPLNETTTYTHNSIGWPTQVTDPMNYTATVSYNSYGDPLVITDTRHYTTTYSYDNDRNLIHVTDADFHTITNTYDLDNELTRATQPDGTRSDYLYDGYGRVISQTNGLGQTTRYAYDDVNRINTVTDPLTRTASYAYDLAGNTTVITDARGLTTTYGYDNAYQLTGITYHDSGATPNVSYLYDNLGRRTVMTDGTGTSLYSYDSLNRLTSYQNGAGNSMGYGYDLASRITSITYPGTSHTVTRGYDDANRLTSVTDWLSPSNTTAFFYNHDGALTSQNYPNQTQMTVGRDAAQEVTSITHVYTPTSTNIVSFTYSYDPVGVLSSTVDSPTGSHNYSNDQLYRLLGDQIAGKPQSNWTYAYDAATEITSTTTYINGGNTTTGTRTYDAADELKTLLETQGGTKIRSLSLTYNNSGDRTTQYDSVSGVSNGYTYDQQDRLVKYTSGSTTNYSYGYNGDGLRMSKLNLISGPPPPMPGAGAQPGSGKGGSGQASPAVVPIQYTWDIAQGLPLMVQDTFGSYIYGPGGEIVEQIDSSGNAYYYHADQLGSIRALTNSSGSVAESYSYDAYGNTTASSGSTLNQFKYAGEYQDAESNLYYLRARYYDPSTQQFLTVDPLVGWTEQAYAYAAGSPTNFIDPTGWDVDCGLGEPCAHFQSKRSNTSDGSQTSSKPTTLKPGPYAGESVPATNGPSRDFTPEERSEINRIGSTSGCHTCGSTDPGTKSGNFIPDHQPPNALNPNNDPQNLYPQCKNCSRDQFGEVGRAKAAEKRAGNPNPYTSQPWNNFEDPQTVGEGIEIAGAAGVIIVVISAVIDVAPAAAAIP